MVKLRLCWNIISISNQRISVKWWNGAIGAFHRQVKANRINGNWLTRLLHNSNQILLGSFLICCIWNKINSSPNRGFIIFWIKKDAIICFVSKARFIFRWSSRPLQHMWMIYYVNIIHLILMNNDFVLPNSLFLKVRIKWRTRHQFDLSYKTPGFETRLFIVQLHFE